MTPLAVVVFGIGLLLLARLHATTNRRAGVGVISDPPAMLRRLFGASVEGLPMNDLLIGLIGVLWVAAGAGLAITGQSAESPAFATVVRFLIVTFVVDGIAATVIWIRRELQTPLALGRSNRRVGYQSRHDQLIVSADAPRPPATQTDGAATDEAASRSDHPWREICGGLQP